MRKTVGRESPFGGGDRIEHGLGGKFYSPLFHLDADLADDTCLRRCKNFLQVPDRDVAI